MRTRSAAAGARRLLESARQGRQEDQGAKGGDRKRDGGQTGSDIGALRAPTRHISDLASRESTIFAPCASSAGFARIFNRASQSTSVRIDLNGGAPMPWPNKLTNLLKIRLPIIQAPMGSIAGPELASAACRAGALGMLPIWPMPPEAAAQMIGAMGSSGSFGVNLNVAFGPDGHLDLALAQAVPVIHFFWGDAAPFVAKAKSKGALVMQTVSSGEEARRARDAGVDVLIAQGVEAGGHVRGTIGLASLVPAVVDAGSGLPVVAAGGITDGRGAAAALMLGAQGMMLGTALIVANECRAHPDYKRAVIAAHDSDTSFGTVFDLGWRDAPCRVLRNSTVKAWEDAGSPPSGKRPGDGDVVARAGGREIPRYSAEPPTGAVTGKIEAMALYAGQGVGLVHKEEPAGAIITRIADEALSRSGAHAVR
jgi:NAD(P)H-dependent flavin oxidoreductase YrpB (nitropropane dioxygenase family)